MFVDNYLPVPGENESYSGGVIEAFTGKTGQRWDSGLHRPFFNKRGIPTVTLYTGRTKIDPVTKKKVPIFANYSYDDLNRNGIHSPVINATSLTKDEWIEFDEELVGIARNELRAWADLAGWASKRVEGMSSTILESNTTNDPGIAVQDMDAITDAFDDGPVFQPEGLPLPITHSDFWVSKRNLMISRKHGEGIDTRMGEAAMRRVAEMIEQSVIGSITGMTYGDATRYTRASTVYGYLTAPQRITYTGLTTPTSSNPEATVNDVLAMRQRLYNLNFKGPYMLYHATNWDPFMDNDYARLGGTNSTLTLRERLKKIQGIADVRRLDNFSGTTYPFGLLMVQMTKEVARAIIGMPIQTVQWEMKGGLKLCFKVMTIMVPQIRADYAGSCGIIQATL